MRLQQVLENDFENAPMSVNAQVDVLNQKLESLQKEINLHHNRSLKLRAQIVNLLDEYQMDLEWSSDGKTIVEPKGPATAEFNKQNSKIMDRIHHLERIKQDITNRLVDLQDLQI